jgi:serine/threonine protein phosphatase 1
MSNGRVWVMGDIHGAYKAMLQCFDRSGFDPQNDTLIALGDVCDGWSEIDKCIDLLLSLPQVHFILGNHDYWALRWSRDQETPEMWLQQGGQATVDAYSQGMPESHQQFLSEAHLYYLHQQSLFVHAGIDPDLSLDLQDQQMFLWDRSLCNTALRMKQQSREENLGPYEAIYIGHTPTIRSGYTTPTSSGNVWMMDTGAAWDGRLSIMDIASKEYFQSDPTPGLYPGEKGRF